jgi:Lon protease-like protein
VRDAGEDELLERVRQAAPRVKLFPLPEVALFPNHGLPLHVFETRYRELTKDVLEGDGVLAIPQIHPEEAGAKPRLSPILGIGVVAEHHRLPGGKFNLIVRGVARARLLRELPSSHAYREAQIEILSEDLDGVTEQDGTALAACLLELGRHLSTETQAALAQLASMQSEPGRLADLAAAALLTPALHQRVLGELNVKRRLEFVTDQVAELLLAARPTPSGESGLLN